MFYFLLYCFCLFLLLFFSIFLVYSYFFITLLLFFWNLLIYLYVSGLFYRSSASFRVIFLFLFFPTVLPLYICIYISSSFHTFSISLLISCFPSFSLHYLSMLFYCSIDLWGKFRINERSKGEPINVANNEQWIQFKWPSAVSTGGFKRPIAEYLRPSDHKMAQLKFKYNMVVKCHKMSYVEH